jgi:hypothetical protein
MTKPSARAPALATATKQRGRLASAQADLAEIKAAKLRGELVEAARLWKSSGQACFARSARVCWRCRRAWPRGFRI